jgi:hypothetical protein
MTRVEIVMVSVPNTPNASEREPINGAAFVAVPATPPTSGVATTTSAAIAHAPAVIATPALTSSPVVMTQPTPMPSGSLSTSAGAQVSLSPTFKARSRVRQSRMGARRNADGQGTHTCCATRCALHVVRSDGTDVIVCVVRSRRRRRERVAARADAVAETIR